MNLLNLLKSRGYKGEAAKGGRLFVTDIDTTAPTIKIFDSGQIAVINQGKPVHKAIRHQSETGAIQELQKHRIFNP